jgi:putative tricarboxylic transport membrane protein
MMHICGQTLRTAAAAVVIGSGALLGASAVFAQELPNMTIVVPSSPGGGFDQTARAVQSALQAEGIAAVVTVENHPGGGGAIALGQVTNHPGDIGRSMIGGLALVTAGLTTNAPVTVKALTQVARLTSEWQVLAVPANSDIKTVEDLKAKLQAAPSSIAWGGGAAGSLDHVTAALVAEAMGVDPKALNYVAYSGGGEVAVAVMGGHVPVGVSGVSEFQENAKAGRLRILAVLSDEPLPGVDAPTLKQSGIDLSVGNWRSIHGAPDLSAADREKLVAALGRMVEGDAWKQELEKKGWSSAFLAGDEFAGFVDAEWGRIKETLAKLGLTQ